MKTFNKRIRSNILTNLKPNTLEGSSNDRSHFIKSKPHNNKAITLNPLYIYIYNTCRSGILHMTRNHPNE